MPEMTKILFLDDEPAVLEGLKRQLSPFQKAWNMSFQTCPLYAMECHNLDPVDIVVTDIKMPIINGDTIANLLASTPTPPGIVFLSSHSSKQELEEQVTLPFEYVRKPCNRDELVMAISSVLSTKPTRVAALYDEVLELVVLRLRESGIIRTEDLPSEYRNQLGIRKIAEILGEDFCFELAEKDMNS